VAKIPKVYPVLFLDRPGSGIGLLATAIGRQNYTDSAQFAVATPGAGEMPSPALSEFLEETGLSDRDLNSEPLEALEHDLSHYVVLVAVNGKVADYVRKVPFHTSVRNWSIPGDIDRAEQYRLLSREISDLVALLAGTDPNKV
jgi:hypothetical protein